VNPKEASMGEIINLRRARKARVKEEAEAEAARNRALHGRGKAARAEEGAEAARRRLRDRTLDAGRIEGDDDTA
jgi:hypothetical protein